MATLTLKQLTFHVLGGTDGNGAGNGPIMVLLHGFGAPGTDLVGLYRVLEVPSDCRVIFPEAPLRLPPEYGDARAWWMPDMARMERTARSGQSADLSNELPAELETTRTQLVEGLHELIQELAPTDPRIILGGFSQGAMLALAIALGTDIALRGLVLLSGALLNAQEWRPLIQKREPLPVMQSHGQSDGLLSYDAAFRLHELLEAAGWPSTFQSFGGGHEIPPSVLRTLNEFLVQQFN